MWVVAGSPGMTGAAHLTTRAAQRGGAGYVRLSTPGVDDDPGRPTEAVGVPLPEVGWADEVLEGAERFRSLAVGPGLGHATRDRRRGPPAPPRRARRGGGRRRRASPRSAASPPTSCPGASTPPSSTPHDGELARLGADADDPDRIGVTRALAARLGAVVLRKGSTTVVAAPDGATLLSTSGDARLATAGTGDVLTGLLAALRRPGRARRSRRRPPAAHLHGRAGALALPRGLVAGDVVDRLPAALAELPED